MGSWNSTFESKWRNLENLIAKPYKLLCFGHDAMSCSCSSCMVDDKENRRTIENYRFGPGCNELFLFVYKIIWDVSRLWVNVPSARKTQELVWPWNSHGLVNIKHQESDLRGTVLKLYPIASEQDGRRSVERSKVWWQYHELFVSIYEATWDAAGSSSSYLSSSSPSYHWNFQVSPGLSHQRGVNSIMHKPWAQFTFKLSWA